MIGVWVLVLCILGLMVAWGQFAWSSDRRRLAETAPATAAEIEALRQRQASLAESVLGLVVATAPGFSKIGGIPDAPAELSWPVGPEGAMDFLVQIDLAEARVAGGPAWLPEAGSLYLFFDARWGFADQGRVLFAPPGERGPLSPPAGVDPYPERRVAFEQRAVQPGLDWLGEDLRRWPEDLWGAEDADETPRHKIGGYPDQIQNEDIPQTCQQEVRKLPGAERAGSAAPEDPARSWRLLTQIDSDDDLGMNWSDTGRIFVLVREADARAGDFSRTVTITQTY